MAEEKQYNRNQIRKLEDFFWFRSSPEEDLRKNPSLAQKAISLLDKLKELTGVEYVFVHIQKMSPYGGGCTPFPRNF